MKITKRTLGRAEKLINIIVILVMLLQPVGAPGLLRAVADDVALAEDGLITEPVALNSEPIEEDLSPAEEAALVGDNSAEKEVDPASEPETISENGEAVADVDDFAIAGEETAGAESDETTEGQAENAEEENSSEDAETVADPEVPVDEIPAPKNSAEEESAVGVLEESSARISQINLSLTSALSIATYSDGTYSAEKEQYQQDETAYIKATGLFISRYYRIDVLEPDNTKHNVYSCKKNNTEATAVYAIPADADASDQWKVEIKKYESSGACNSEDALKDSASDMFTVVAQEQPTPVCGDGIVDGEEQCDDGNDNDGDVCNNKCELKKMKKESVRTCNGEGELYAYVDDPFQDIATSFTTDRDQLLIFTGNPPVYSLDVKVDGAPAGKTKIFADQWVEIFSVDTVPGALVTVEGSSANGARNVQGYLAQDKANPVYDIAATEVIWDDARTSNMYLTPGEYSYLFFDKYTYNSKSQQDSGNKDQRKLNVKINGLGPLIDKTYTAPFPSPAEGVVVDNYSVAQSGTYALTVDTEDSIYWVLPKCEPLVPIIEVNKIAEPTTLPEPGGEVTFTFTVTNTGIEPVTITSLTDDVFGTLSGDADCQVGTVLASNESCTFDSLEALAGNAGDFHTDVFTAHAEDNEGTDATDDDDATVKFTDVLPTVTLDKTVDDKSKPEPGGTFNYTLTITNTSTEDVVITQLTDDNVLSQECLDLVGDVLVPSQQVSCGYSVLQTETGIYTNTAAVTVEDNDKNTASADDDESVEITDVLPVIEVLKTAGVSALDVPSASVTFTFMVKNNSIEPVTITSLTDDVFGTLSGDADCQVGTILDPGAECFFDSVETVNGTADAAHVNVFTAHAEDNEKNDAAASDDETITFNAGRIIVDKVTDPAADPRSFDFTLAGGPSSAIDQKFSLTDLSVPYDSGPIFPGTYSVIEDVAAGWLTDASCSIENQTIFEEVLAIFASSSPDKIVLEPGQTIRCTFTNTFIPPVLTIEKFNDQWPNIQDPGDTVDYTIIVRASDNNVYGAFVKDLLPPGFSFAGVTSVQKNGSALAVADPAYASPGTWKLGDLAKGDEVVIRFKARIADTQDPGIYKDLAWAQGTDDQQVQVLATSVPAPKTDQGVITDNFVGTQIELAPVPQPEEVVLAERTKTETRTKNKTKKVLGAAILPDTGADTIWLLVALLLLFTGFNLIMESKKRSRRNYATINKTLMKIFIATIFSGAVLLSAISAHAATDPNISVRIEKPKAQVDTNEFKIGFVALDIQERNLTAKCFMVPSEEVPIDFAVKAGGNSGSCLINLPDGTYQFYVVAYDPANSVNYGQSEIVTVEINTGAPSIPLNYDRDGNSCTVNFITANDGLTAGVELYRSTDINFAADDSTYVGTADIGPNVSGSLIDPNGDCGNHYYAIRAVSAAGAGSAFIGDEKVTVKRRTRTRTRTVTIHPEVATGAIPVAETGGPGLVEGVSTEEGQVAPGEAGVVLGEETEGAGKSPSTLLGILQKNRWLFVLGMLIILTAIYAYWKKRIQGGKK